MSRRLGVCAVGAVLAAAFLVGPSARPAESAPRSDLRGTFALGDSVMLGARPCLERRGARVDSVGSRQIAAGLHVLRQQRTSLPARVVVHLGTNGGLDADHLRVLMHVLRDVDRIVVITIQLPNDYSRYTFEERTNAALRALDQRYERVRLVEWNERSDRQSNLLWGDHTHLTPTGCEVYARMVERAVNAP